MTPVRRVKPASEPVSQDALVELRVLVDVVDSVLSAKANELTLPQLRALVALAALGPTRSIDLATALSLDPSTVSRLCTRLKARRLVDAQRSSESAREVRIELTSRGHAVLDAVRSGGLAEVQRALATLDKIDSTVR